MITVWRHIQISRFCVLSSHGSLTTHALVSFLFGGEASASLHGRVNSDALSLLKVPLAEVVHKPPLSYSGPQLTHSAWALQFLLDLFSGALLPVRREGAARPLRRCFCSSCSAPMGGSINKATPSDSHCPDWPLTSSNWLVVWSDKLSSSFTESTNFTFH